MDDVTPPWARRIARDEMQTHAAIDMCHDLLCQKFAPQSIRMPVPNDDTLRNVLQLEKDPNQSVHCYSLVDAAQSLFLPERLEISGLKHHCLYDIQQRPELAESAPWLVALEADARFSKGTLCFDATSSDPANMFGHGIWLKSHLDIVSLRDHLRGYTFLQDEVGVRQYFRLQEAGMLDALLLSASPDAREKFFSGVDQIIYPWPTLQPQTWDLVAVSSATDRDKLPVHKRSAAKLDAPARKRLQGYVNDRKARLLAVDRVTNEAERAQACDVFFRMLMAGYETPTRLLEAWRLVRRLSAPAQQAFWRDIESGQHSPRRVILVFAQHYKIDDVFEDLAA